MKGFVYVLRDAHGRYYIGSTSDIDRRLKQHRHGHTSTTRRMKNLEIVLSQEYATLTEARRVERKIKKLKRKDYLGKMVTDGYIRITPS